MENKPEVILACQLVKRFGDFTAVDGVDFQVGRGEIFGLLGPNGSGKTTTIRMLLGLLDPTAGTAEVLGVSVNGGSRQLLPRLGYMSQRFSLYNDLTVRQNLQFYGRSYGLSNSELSRRLEEILAIADLSGREDTPTRDLSGGWRQRLALGAAILHHPEVIFLDEPTAGVDPLSRRAFWNLLYQLAGEGVTVFVTTHYMDEAEHCHRLAFIQHGQIIASGTPQQIKAEMMPGQVLEISTSDTVLALKTLREACRDGRLTLENVELFGTLIHVVALQAKEHRRDIIRELRQAGIKVESMDIVQPNLEDVFVASMRS